MHCLIFETLDFFSGKVLFVSNICYIYSLKLTKGSCLHASRA